MNDVSNSSTRDRGKPLIFEQRAMCGAVGRLVDADGGEGRELVLQFEPARLRFQICRQDEERFSSKRREGFSLIEAL